MKHILPIIFVLLASQASACGNGECEPPPPPPPPPPPIQVVEESDRDPQPSHIYYPCCLRAGEVEPLWNLFMKPEKTKLFCEKALARGDALIYECPGIVSPEALK